MKNKEQNIKIIDFQEFDVFSANFIKEKIEEIFVNKKILNIALSGGSTPIPILNKLKSFNLNWSKINFFLVDERVVNVNSEQSNYRNINEVFFKYISSNNYSILHEKLSLDQMVEKYKNQILSKLDFNESNQPKFDLIILGMGEDGHTASLFPDTTALTIENDFVVKNYIPTLNNNRITLTFPAILSCEEIIVLIKGKEKIKVFEQIMSGNGEQYPIAKLLSNKMNWILEK